MRTSSSILFLVVGLGLSNETRETAAAPVLELLTERNDLNGGWAGNAVIAAGEPSVLRSRASFVSRSHRAAYVRLVQLEEVILGLADGRSLSVLRPLLIEIYPELAPDIPAPGTLPVPMLLRQAAELHRLRLEITRVVLTDYTVLSETLAELERTERIP